MTSKLLTPRYIIFIFILINLICSLFIVSDYGRSPDEFHEEARAQNAINGFSSWEKFQKYRALDKKVLASAPSLIFTLIENAANKIIQTPPGVVKHYLYLVSFQVGVYSFFIIAKRILNEWNALAMTLLFGTQPLYVGHAFINPKDIPFMAAFLATIASGFYMADHLISLISNSKKPGSNGTNLPISSDWSNLSRGKKSLFIISLLFWPLLYLMIKSVPLALEQLIYQAYYSPDESILHNLFLQIANASDSVSVASYISKAQQLIERYVVYSFIFLFILEIFLLLRFLPSIRQRLSHVLIEPFTLSSQKSLREFWFPISSAGIVWGFCLSSKIGGQILGLTAGGLVGLYLLLKVREKAVFPCILYSLIASISLYLFWPNIWFTGFSGFFWAIAATPSFSWRGGVLYNGAIFSLPNDTLPRSYLPHLISIQFTEPVIILGFLGIILVGFLTRKRNLDPSIIFILNSWLILPILYSIISQPTHYNNFRQYIFITPPLFIFAGISFNEIVQLIKKRWLVAIMFILMLVPGVISLYQLHPYQYIYYNNFVGGVEGAFRRFELDYWFTSYMEAIEYLNQVAPPNAKILHWRDGSMLKYYSRDDLVLTNQNTIDSRFLMDFDFGIVPSSLNADINNLLSADTIYQIERDHVVLVVVKKIR